MTLKHSVFENLPSAKQEKIMSEATQEFAEHGFHQASINRMVERLGIAKGSLFKYFGTKEGLFEYVFGHAVHLLKGPLKKIRTQTKGDDFFQRIRLVTLAGVDFIQAHPHIYRIYLKMLFQENFPMREKFLGKVRETSAKFLNSLVQEAMETGQLGQNINPTVAVYFLDSSIDRFLQSVAVPFLDGKSTLHEATRQTIETRLDDILLLLQHGLSGTPYHD